MQQAPDYLAPPAKAYAFGQPRYAIAIASYSGMLDPELSQLIAQLSPVALHMRSGLSDVALARSTVLTAVVDDPKCGREFDAVLLLDDDIIFCAEDAEYLVSRVRQTGRAHSGNYITSDARSTATTWPPFLTPNPGPAGERQFLCGLGFCAVSVATLQRLQRERPRVRVSHNVSIVPFCASGPDFANNCWVSEDHHFSRAVNGFLLEPVCAGHLKKIALWPDQALLERQIAGEELPHKPEIDPQLGRRPMAAE